MSGLLLITSARPAVAGASLQFQAAPTTLPAGGVISVDAGNCRYDVIDVGLTVGWEDSYSVPKTDPIASTSLTKNAETWHGAVTVPASAVPGAYTLRAVCHGDNGSSVYQNIEITVTEAPTTVTAATTTVPATTTMPSSPPAAVAPAIVGKPAYTG